MIPVPNIRWRALVLVPVAAFALSACATGDAPAATVGQTEITNARLEADTALFRFLTGLSGAPCGTPEGQESEDSACTRFTLANDIREEVVKQYAVANDLSVPAGDVDAAIEQVITSLGGAEVLDERLQEENLDRADLEGLARRLLLFGEVERAVAADRITDEQLQPLYDSQQQQYTTVEVGHILVPTEEEAREIADTVTPGTFASVAADRSIDEQSAQNGGSLGTYSEAQFLQTFDPTFAEAALALDVGEISEAVETQFGWHVIQLSRRDVAAFEDVREDLAGQLSGQVFQEWMLERLEALDVEVNPRYGRLDPDTGQVLRVRSTDPDVSPESTGAPAPTGPTGATP